MILLKIAVNVPSGDFEKIGAQVRAALVDAVAHHAKDETLGRHHISTETSYVMRGDLAHHLARVEIVTSDLLWVFSSTPEKQIQTLIAHAVEKYPPLDNGQLLMHITPAKCMSS